MFLPGGEKKQKYCELEGAKKEVLPPKTVFIKILYCAEKTGLNLFILLWQLSRMRCL